MLQMLWLQGQNSLQLSKQQNRARTTSSTVLGPLRTVLGQKNSPQKRCEAIALLVGLSTGNPPKIGTFTAWNCTRNRTRTPPDYLRRLGFSRFFLPCIMVEHRRPWWMFSRSSSQASIQNSTAPWIGPASCYCQYLFSCLFLGARLMGRTATQRSKKGSEKVLGRVLGKGSEKGSENGACYGFYSENRVLRRVLRRGSEKGLSRRCVERPLKEYAPLSVRPIFCVQAIFAIPPWEFGEGGILQVVSLQ